MAVTAAAIIAGLSLFGEGFEQIKGAGFKEDALKLQGKDVTVQELIQLVKENHAESVEISLLDSDSSEVYVTCVIKEKA